ncbi:PcF and SCR74-like cys-rich secreted peptide [Phytophthora palmivora]|uniref:PcF and SCR74-like cys-rich secreted peptide n=1 Tax=Phytophthora palmivora TaxID=4796 RepID=A0A2P4XNT7_9STRA|nr:PcF and SCR74-like cys-rich secreted peptide [Phytophthora palmivora]
MNFKVYFAVVLATVAATSISAQQYCTAQGCAYIYSDSNIKTKSEAAISMSAAVPVAHSDPRASKRDPKAATT